MPDVVVYARVLRCGPAEPEACPDLRGQLRACRERIASIDAPGTGAAVLTDESGEEDAGVRPGIIDLERRILARTVAAVVVATLPALASDIDELSRLWALFQLRDIRFIAVREGIDSGDPSGRSILDVLTRPVVLRLSA